MNRQRSISTTCVVLAGVVALAAAVTGRAALVTDGLNKNFEAGLAPDGDADSQWENTTGNGTNLNWTFVNGNRNTDPVADPTVPAITQAYTFAASIASAASYDFFSSASASFELWFKPADLVGTHVLFETGGAGAGTAFYLDGSDLFFRVQQSPDVDHVAMTRAALPTARWFQAVGIIHLDTGMVQLYLNGHLVDSATAPAGLTTWAGGNESGLGQVAGTVAGDMATTAFTGRLAILRFYDRALSADEVGHNYHLVAEPASMLTLGGLAMAGCLRRRCRRAR